MVTPLNSTNIIFVHGLFGWGPGELGNTPYWGDALHEIGAGFSILEAKVGPLSSFHDRACELFARIRGGTVDYGEAHSAAAGHARHGRTFPAFMQEWSGENPVILIGHSAGAQTCLQLQALLAADFWGLGTNADWVEAIVSVAGVINGSLLPYKFGCDRESGLLTGFQSGLIATALGVVTQIAGRVSGMPIDPARTFDLCLDHWPRGADDAIDVLMGAGQSPFVKGEDNLGFDLSLQGCLKANKAFKSNPNTYYLSFVTGTLDPGWSPFAWLAKDRIIPLLLTAFRYQAKEVDFATNPIDGWGAGDMTLDLWRANDGAVSSISQTHPFTNGAEPLGGEGIFGRADQLERGRWRYENLLKATGLHFDHFDPVVGAMLKPGVREAHRELYRKLGDTLRALR